MRRRFPRFECWLLLFVFQHLAQTAAAALASGAAPPGVAALARRLRGDSAEDRALCMKMISDLLGAYLATLYENLERFDRPFDVRAAFDSIVAKTSTSSVNQFSQSA